MAENNIVHIEFRADDLDAAEQFYGKLFISSGAFQAPVSSAA